MLILIGTDPTLHFNLAQPLIDNAINFAAAGVDRTGTHKTGLYFALSCYYDSTPDPVPVQLVNLFPAIPSRPFRSAPRANPRLLILTLLSSATSATSPSAAI